MNWYKIAQIDQTIWQLKNKIIPLNDRYMDFLQKEWKEKLTPEEEIEKKKVGDELNQLADLRDKKIKELEEVSKKAITEGREHEVDPDNFLKYHYTGQIPEHAYEQYETKKGLAWLGKYEDHPFLVKSKNYDGEIIEFRKDNKPLKYTKLDENDDIVRDENGKALYMSEEEMKQKGLPLTETDIVAFNSNKEPIGSVSNEFGADGVWVIKDYQGKGIGTDLLYEFRKQFPSNRKIGQMTNAGVNMTRKYHKKLVEEALKQGKYVPEDILKEYGL